MSSSGVLIVDADLGEIDYAKGRALIEQFPKLPLFETCLVNPWPASANRRETSNPLACLQVDQWLKDHRIQLVVIMGDDRHGGVSAAALSALELGYDVYVIDDATTFLSSRSGKLFKRRLWATGGIVIPARYLACEFRQSSEPFPLEQIA